MQIKAATSCTPLAVRLETRVILPYFSTGCFIGRNDAYAAVQ
jgi:hypothetical protein